MEKQHEMIDEPVILSIEAYRRSDPPSGHDPRPERSDRDVEPRIESYWAGRNLAMRRSARWAA
jgi:hypothetical protein